MSDTAVGIYTIGQTPRPDLTENLARDLGSFRLEIRGALDGLTADQLPACGADGYPLETRLRDGTRVVVDAAFLEPRLQDAIAECDDGVAAHLVLCAGPFPGLTSRGALVRPFDVAVTELAGRGFRSLEVVVPFAAQASPSVRKWEAAGFSGRTHVLGEMPSDRSVAHWLPDRLADTRADALVLDYVGLPAAILAEVGAAIDIPVFDLGHLAMNALARTLEGP